MMKKIVVLAAFCLACVRVMACECLPVSVLEEFRASTDVFHGKVKSVDGNTFIIEIIESWKGNSGTGTFTLIQGRTSCEKRTFDAGEEYLFYVSGNSVYNCSNTVPFASASPAALAVVRGNTTITLRGILTTKKGDALAGCSVMLKGEHEARTTGKCGEFEIEVSADYSGVLVFACMAPRTFEVPVAKLKNVDHPILSLVRWPTFEDGPCDKNYKNEKRIKVR